MLLKVRVRCQYLPTSSHTKKAVEMAIIIDTLVLLLSFLVAMVDYSGTGLAKSSVSKLIAEEK